MLNCLDGKDDLFEEAFPIAIAAAKQYCRGRNDANDLCFLYHSSWPRLRKLGVQKSIWMHAENYINTFERLATEGSRRILVSGSADYSLSGFVLHAFRKHGVEPEITVLDQCEAPLRLNCWYAERFNANITTIAINIFEFEDAEGFDLVTTDNFLTRFGPNDRARIFAKWNALLRPSGTLVTAQNIDPSSDLHERSLSEGEIQRKLDKIRQSINTYIGELDIPGDSLIRDVENYYKNRTFSRICSSEEACHLFEANGFRIESISEITSQGVSQLRHESQPDCSIRTFFLARKSRPILISRPTS